MAFLAAPLTAALGSFTVEVGANGVRVTRAVGAALAGTTVWETRHGESFVNAYRGSLATSGTAGHLYLKERSLESYTRQTVESAVAVDDHVEVRGALSSRADRADRADRASRASRSGGVSGAGGASSTGSPNVRVYYVLKLTAVDDDQLGIEVDLLADDGSELPTAATAHAQGWWTELHWRRDPDASQFGFGAQFSRLDMAGRRVPILTAEQGVGRGAQPITFLANLKGGAGGRWWSTYAPAPVALGSDLTGFYLSGTYPCQFDFRAKAGSSVRVYAARLAARAFRAASPTGMLEVYTRFSGRMEPLPDWVHAGAIVGMQGGSAKAERVVADLRRHGAPVAAVWLQDWVGNRKVGFGQRLWWDWQLDRERYPEWEAMSERLTVAGTQTMVYVNPFLADMSARPGGRPDLYHQAEAAGYFVKRADGTTYDTDQGDFKAGLIDLSDPAAREWYLSALSEKLSEAGSLGWMADFGEGLPLDAVVHSGTALEWHNHYPEAWAEFNAELRERLAAASGRRASDYVTFFRSGYARSPRHARLFWLGDQTVTWDRHDGLRSALTGLLSSGLSGFSLQHGDVGGYTSTVPPLPKLVRDRELLARWAEMLAFSVVLRTHEGNRPSLNAQVYDDEETLADYARAARLHAAWRPLRETLMHEAAASGLPVVRHAWLEYPEDRRCLGLDQQFFLGPDLLVAPVLARRATSVRAYLPSGSGTWRHVFSDAEYPAGEGRWIDVPAPIGRPGLFVRDGSEAARTDGLLRALRAAAG